MVRFTLCVTQKFNYSNAVNIARTQLLHNSNCEKTWWVSFQEKLGEACVCSRESCDAKNEKTRIL